MKWKFFFLIGWRNLWRNKHRSVVVILSISLGIWAMILSMALMNGMNNQMVENTIGTTLGHISIHQQGLMDDLGLARCYQPSPDLETALNTLHLAAAPRIKLEGMVRSSEASRGVLIVGVDPAKEKKVSDIYRYMCPDPNSQWFSDPSAHDIIMSRTLAQKLDLWIGDKVILMFQDIDQELVAVAFRLIGLYQSPIDSFDKFVVFTGIKAMAKLTGLGHRISQYTIRLAHRNQVDEMAQRLSQFITTPGIEVFTWKQMAPNLIRAVNLFDRMMYIFFAIIFITVVFSIANTLIMAIMERFHEIGVIKALGTSPVWVGAMVMFEAIGLGFVGLAVGIGVGLGCVSILAVTGIDFSFYMESTRLLGTGSIIYPAIKLMDIWVCTVIVLATTVLAASYPMVKAVRIKPLEALHFI